MTSYIFFFGKPDCDVNADFYAKMRMQSEGGRPTPQDWNGFCESFNNRVRQELLNSTWFRSIDDARRHAADWRQYYNTKKSHSSLDDQMPEEFARRSKKQADIAVISRALAV
ncbi:MAG: hypothetical protein NVSMB64_27030 [Candidatus Velthaea sp.]